MSAEDPTTPLNNCAPARTSAPNSDASKFASTAAPAQPPLMYDGTAPDPGVPVVVSAPYALYRGVPCGSDTYTWSPHQRQLFWMSKRCCCCGCCSALPEGDPVQLPTTDSSSSSQSTSNSGGNAQGNLNLDLIVAREPISCVRLVRDAFLSFLFAMLFHFVPAVLSGVASALGSAENHSRWGLVWFGLWPIWWLIATGLLRPWGVRVVDARDQDDGGCCGARVLSFLPCTTHDMAVEMSVWLRGLMAKGDAAGSVALSVAPFSSEQVEGAAAQEGNSNCNSAASPPSPRSFLRPATVLGTSILIFLLAWGVYTWLLIEECSNMGCCKDDGRTLANCTRMWDERN